MKTIVQAEEVRSERIPEKVFLVTDNGERLGEIHQTNMGYVVSSRFLEMIDRDPFACRPVRAANLEDAAVVGKQILVEELTAFLKTLESAITELQA